MTSGLKCSVTQKNIRERERMMYMQGWSNEYLADGLIQNDVQYALTRNNTYFKFPDCQEATLTPTPSPRYVFVWGSVPTVCVTDET